MIGVKVFIRSHLCEKLVAEMPHKVGVERLGVDCRPAAMESSGLQLQGLVFGRRQQQKEIARGKREPG